MGPKMAHFFGHYWYKQRIIPKAGNFLGRTFGTGWGITQGNPSLQMIFNILVYAVIWAVLAEVCRQEEAKHRLGWAAGERNLVFYEYDGWIAGKEPYWTQDAPSVTLDMFCRVSLDTDLEKKRQWFSHRASYGARLKRRHISGERRGRGNVSGEKTDEGKLLIVQGIGGGFITHAPHGAATWGNTDTDTGS